jgi:hypothetical protein
MIVGLPESVSGYGLQVTYVEPEGEMGNVVQTSDANPNSIDLSESGPAAIAVADDGNLLVGGRPGDGSAAYQLVKLDDGNLGAPRPDEFVGALGNDIVRDADGGTHLTYFDVNNRVLKYAHRGPNGHWDEPVTVDAEPDSGHYLSIAVDGNGRPGIAYFDGLHGDLKYAYSAVDGQWKTQLVEWAGNVGLYPSLAFDSAQRATIAYYKKTGGDLKIAVKLTDEEWAYEVIDEANDVGRSPALVAQPMSGRWSIAYTDTTTGDVKYAWRAGVYLHAAISFFDAYDADVRIAQSSGDATLVWSDKLLSTQGLAGMYGHLTFDAISGPTVYFYNRTFDRVTRLTDSYVDGLSGETVVSGAGRYLSVFSDGTTVDIAFYDDDEGVLKVQSMPVRV